MMVSGCALRWYLCIPVAAAVAGPPSSQLLLNSNGASQTWASVGRLRSGMSCTGVWIDPGGTAASGPAYLLTSGHCVSLEPYGVIVDRAVNYQVEFNYFADTRERAITIPVRRVAWSTMKLIDVAILEMGATFGELGARGLAPHRLARTRPREGAAVYWVGAPSGFIPPGRAYLRRGECTALGSTTLLEGRWLWFDQIRNDCPDVYAAASGSPLFEAATREIVGVLGTSTLLSTRGGPDYDCFQNRPCAVRESGAVVEEDTSYASPVAEVAGCFDGAGRFDLGLAGCSLDRGVQFAIDAGRASAVQPVTSTGQPAQWQARLSGPLSYYATQQVPLALAGACRERGGYSAPVALAEAPLFSAPIGTSEGDYLLCVIAGNTPRIDESWQPARHASIRRMRLDGQPLSAAPEFTLTPAVSGAYQLEFGMQAPATGAIEYKRGGLAEMNCSDPGGYRMMLSPPQVIREAEFPQRICVRLADEAGNGSPPLSFDFGPPALQPFGLRNLASRLRTRRIARGSLFRVDAIELTRSPAFAVPPAETLSGVRAELVDAGGARHAVRMSGLGVDHLEALLPEQARLGPGELRIFPAVGPELKTAVEVTESSPGMFAANFLDFGQPLGFYQLPDREPSPVFACAPNRVLCQDRAIPASSGQSVELLILGTGMSRGAFGVRIGSEPVEAVERLAIREWPGVDLLRLRLGAGWPLRGYQLIWVGEQNLRLEFE